MMYSKRRYELQQEELRAIKEERDMWKAKYLATTEGRVTYTGSAVIVSEDLISRLTEDSKKAQEVCLLLEDELKKWKQMYADEVQKRLALIEQLGNTQAV